MQKVREFLESFTGAEPLAKSGPTRVYALGTTPDLKNYVLKVTKADGFAEALRQSTSLTPVEQLVTQRNIGQTFMVLDSPDRNVQISILRRQPGRALHDLKEDFQERDAFTKAEANLLVMEKILEVPEGINPFLRLFQDGYAVASSGRKADFHHKNILFDETSHRLGAVDQEDNNNDFVTKYRRASAEKELKEAEMQLRSEFELGYHDERSHSRKFVEDYKRVFEQTNAMIAKAKGDVIARHREARTLPKKLEFAQVGDVKAVSLDDSVFTLVEQLKELEKRSNIPSL